MVAIPDLSPAKLRLFVAYSRFEFALKEAGYILPDRRRIAHADWRSFANEECLKDVLQVAAADVDVREMIAEPPKVQASDDGKCWHWEETMEKPIQSLGAFFVATKRVRDNLFHGGKHGEDPRDDVLCRAAWAVLELCLKQHQAVRSMFEGKY